MPCSRPYPLGATLNHEGCNFAIYAPKNKDLQLALFDENNNYQTFSLTNEYAGIKPVSYTHLTLPTSG